MRLDQRRQPPQRVGLFVPVGVAIIDALDAGDGVAHDALGDVRPNAGAAHQLAGGSAQIVDDPCRHVRRQLGVEARLACAEAAIGAIAAAGEDIGVVADARSAPG